MTSPPAPDGASAVLVPPLKAEPPSLILRGLSLFHPGLRHVLAQIEPYTEYWSQSSSQALALAGPTLAVIGDSAALGIGASKPQNSYIGQLQRALSLRDGKDWQVINLARSGARIDDGLERQLPVVEDLAASDLLSLTVCCIGSNDVLWSRKTHYLRTQLKTLIDRLPPNSVLGLVAGGSPRSRLANRTIRQLGAAKDFAVVNPWRSPDSVGFQLAEDRFHPNDAGYTAMAAPFATLLGAPAPAAV